MTSYLEDMHVNGIWQETMLVPDTTETNAGVATVMDSYSGQLLLKVVVTSCIA